MSVQLINVAYIGSYSSEGKEKAGGQARLVNSSPFLKAFTKPQPPVTQTLKVGFLDNN